MREAFGLTWTPAPTSPSLDACSYTWTSKPAASSDSAAARPPMPPPTTPTESPLDAWPRAIERYGAAATWSAAWACRSPMGFSGPAVVSLAVCSSISVFSSAPSSTMNAVRNSQNSKMMMPARAP
jgi:hypothetical protein